LKYILPFFIVFSFVLAGDYSFSHFKFSDYVRQSEFVQIESWTQRPSQFYYFNFYELPIETNRYSIFQCNDLNGYYEQHIEIRLELQKKISVFNKPLKWFIRKFKNPKDTDKDYSVDNRCADSITSFCFSHRLMHDLISNKSDLICIQRCIMLSRISFGYLLFSSGLQNGLYELFT